VTETKESAAPAKDEAPSFRRRMTTAFGWIAGVALGVLLNYGVYMLVGESYPQVPTTFVAVVAGAFGGMGVADRLGERGFRPLGIVAGILLAMMAWLVVAVLMSPADTSPT
jgi:hypothetical protein